MFKTYSSFGCVLLNSASSRQSARGTRICETGLLPYVYALKLRTRQTKISRDILHSKKDKGGHRSHIPLQALTGEPRVLNMSIMGIVDVLQQPRC